MLYNIDYGVAGVIFLSIYYFFLKTQYSTNIKSNQRFRYQIMSILVADLFDVITAITISYASSVPLWLNELLNTILFIAAGFTGYMMPTYINSLLNHDDEKNWLDRINIGILAAYIFLCIINPFTKWLFYFDENRNYLGGPLYFLIAVIPYIYMIETMARVLVVRKTIQKKQFVTTIVFSIVASLGGILQFGFLHDVLLVYFFIAVGSVVLLFSFETPDYQLLVRTTQELRDSQAKLEKIRKKEEKTTRIIHELTKSANWKIEIDQEKHQVLGAYWSPEFRIMIGKEDLSIPDNELWINALHPDDRERASNAFMLGMEEKQPFDEYYRLMDKSGDYRWYRGTGETLTDPETGIFIYQGIIQDVNEEKTKEILSMERAQALEELQLSQKALQRALDEAQEANQAKSRFLSNMSHDIRTPMNAIVGFTDLAIDCIDDKEKVEEWLEKIQLSSNHLLLLINDILDMSRIESGKVSIDLAPANLNEIMTNLQNMIGGQASDKGLELTIDTSELKDENVICDKLRLNQVLLNCVGNSVKFTPAGGSIAIQIQQLMSLDNGRADYCIIIADTGIGMSKKFLEHIFDPFERERTSTISKTQGTGLGMAITKSLVELMGGTIDVESREGEGTTYIITIPLEISGPGNQFSRYVVREEEATIEEMLEALKGKHFLLVDDNATNRMLAKGVLKSKGMTFEEADDGTTAVERMKTAKPGEFAMILMDIQMPIMDGYAATDTIRAMEDPAIANIPILAMTANAFEEDKQECLAHGMNGHIAKPYKADDLVRKMYECIFE